ncbi:MAG: DUF1501 domain-containing protein [Proteobacteria bacterium]|nr:DUF1501 domain-containing protein [Pseudomonadota bacterium]
MDTPNPNQSRRGFLQSALSLSASSAIAPWALNFAALGEAAAAGATDYKALVCVFLYGGNDYANTLVACDPASYARYQALRPNLAYSSASLAATVLSPAQTPVDAAGAARQYALAPELAPLLPLFNDGKMGVLLNVGNLIQPVTKAQYLASSVPLPCKLFSHNDQQSEWQSSGPEGTTSGWAGRMQDLLAGGNSNAVFSCVNVYGNAVFLSGSTTSQYQVTKNGPVALNSANNLFGSYSAARALQSVMTALSRHPLESDYASVMTQALSANQALTAALSSAPAITTSFPAANSLADQLKMVARMASVARTLGVKRQVFFVALNGFDTHDNLATIHPQLLTSVAFALSAFYNATLELGMGSAITAFTASDFGRTLAVNNDGSDHGWGSMHFMLGAAVKGQRFYGIPPAVASNGPDDVGQGRLLHTTSVDKYAATLGKWFGLSDAQLLGVLPNLANYTPGSRDIGFML